MDKRTLFAAFVSAFLGFLAAAYLTGHWGDVAMRLHLVQRDVLYSLGHVPPLNSQMAMESIHLNFITASLLILVGANVVLPIMKFLCGH